MSLPRYPKYKHSGVEWLGDVPEHWDVRSLKRIVSTPITDGPHETPEFIDEGIPFASAESVSSGHLDFAKIRGYISPRDHERYSEKYKPRRNDIFMVKSGATTGVSAIVDTDEDFNIWSPLAAIRCNNETYPRFLLNYLRSRNFLDAVSLNWSFGTQQNIGMGVIGNLAVPSPPFEEQKVIASFLCWETGKNDALVEEQRRLIELMKEKRQAVISHAVTKGLNPDAPMKDSGIEWLGEIPHPWHVKRLKYVAPKITVGIVVEPSKYYQEDGVPALRSLNVLPGEIKKEDLVYISNGANILLAKSQLRAGDLVAVRSGQPGTTAVIPQDLDGCNCIDLIIIRKPMNGNERYLCWYLASDVAKRQFTEGSGGAIQQHFNIGTAMNLLVTLSPPEEQTRIANFIAEETEKLDKLTGEAERVIALLQERRTALISAAVTGKIDVRGLVKEDAA